MSVLLLHSAGERFRGRVMGVRMLAIYGVPIGLLVAGGLIEQIGFAETARSIALIGIGADPADRAALARRSLATRGTGKRTLGSGQRPAARRKEGVLSRVVDGVLAMRISASVSFASTGLPLLVLRARRGKLLLVTSISIRWPAAKV